MPTPEQWRRQAEQLQSLGVNVYVGETTDAVLFTLIEALIASITHLQRHDGAIEEHQGRVLELEARLLELEGNVHGPSWRGGADLSDAPSPS